MKLLSFIFYLLCTIFYDVKINAAADSFMYTILACKIENEEASLDSIKLFIEEQKLNIHQTTFFNKSFLHFAVDTRRFDIAQYLIKQGIDVNSKDLLGFTPLHRAILQAEKIDIATLLIENGTDVNALTDQGETPLHIAAAQRNLAKIKLLIKHNADITIKNNKEETPLDIFMHKFNEEHYKYHLRFEEDECYCITNVYFDRRDTDSAIIQLLTQQ